MKFVLKDVIQHQLALNLLQDVTVFCKSFVYDKKNI